MHIAQRELLRDFARQHADAKNRLDAWEDHVKNVRWRSPHDLKQSYPKASIVDSVNVIFDIVRNKYRLWAKVNYTSGSVLIKKVGTHREYDKWDIQ